MSVSADCEEMRKLSATFRQRCFWDVTDLTNHSRELQEQTRLTVPQANSSIVAACDAASGLSTDLQRLVKYERDYWGWRMRFEVLDGLRGIAALMVALMHLDALHHFYGLPFVRNSYLFVDFFFVLSGFIIAHASVAKLETSSDAASFMVRRFGRVWPLHCAVLLAFIAIECGKWLLINGVGVKASIDAFNPAGATPLAAIPYHLALLQGMGLTTAPSWNQPSWSISAEFWTYLVFALVTLAPVRWQTPYAIAIVITAMTTLVTSVKGGMDTTIDYGFFRCLAGFFIGVLVYRLRSASIGGSNFIPNHQYLKIAEFAAVVGTIGFVTTAGHGALSFAASLVFALVVYIFSFETGAVSRVLQMTPFKRLGLWSYSIYIVHALLIHTISLLVGVSQKALFGRDIRDVVNFGGVETKIVVHVNTYVLDALLVGYLIAVVAVASLTYRFIEDPCRRALNRVADRLGGWLKAGPLLKSSPSLAQPA
jgi:peptidoglycan/LPS O-acetylase OafA/YrhL